MNTDAIESMVRDVLNRMNSLQDAAPVSAVPSASIQNAKVTDYPLANKHPEWVKTATNKTLDDFTLENVLSDNVTARICALPLKHCVFRPRLPEMLVVIAWR